MSTTSKGALDGIRVLDLSQWVAGPFTTQTLGDHGAEVIKIEPPEGDVGRKMGKRNAHGFSVYDFSMGRNKKAISLDLAGAEGKAVLFRLLDQADVLVSNFRPGVMEKLGLGYGDVLKQRFPRLIYASVSAFGVDGPYGGIPGMDPVGQAMSGIMARQGTPGGPPDRLSLSLSDHAAAMFLTIGILMALIERGRSGLGQAVEATLLDSTIALNHPYAVDWFMTGQEPPRMGNRHITVAPLNVYKCSDGYVSLGTASDKQFRSLCEALGTPDMADDPRYATVQARMQHVDEIDRQIEELCANVSKVEISDKLMRQGIPAAPVLTMGEALNHPQVLHRKLILEDDSIGFRNVGTPIALSRTPGGLFRRPSRFGEHSREALAQAGFAPEEIDALIDNRVLFEMPASTKAAG